MFRRATILIPAVVLAAALLPVSASAQLLSETTEGNARICRYAPATNVLSVGALRTLRVGLGENCPFAPPLAQVPSLPAPPTAQLRSDSVAEQRRICVYEQAGRSWTLETAASASCPLYAGMAAGGEGRARSD